MIWRQSQRRRRSRSTDLSRGSIETSVMGGPVATGFVLDAGVAPMKVIVLSQSILKAFSGSQLRSPFLRIRIDNEGYKHL